MNFTEKDFDTFKLKVLQPGYIFRLDNTSQHFMVIDQCENTNTVTIAVCDFGISLTSNQSEVTYSMEHNETKTISRVTINLDMIYRVSTGIYASFTYIGKIISDTRTLFKYFKSKTTSPKDCDREIKYINIKTLLKSFLVE